MTTLVKICGLSDTVNVNAALDAGADAIGFVFTKSVRQVSVEQALAASRHISKKILRVAVMLHPTQEEWRVVSDGFSPDVLQTDAADFRYLDVADNIARWPVIREGRAKSRAKMPETFVYEGVRSGQGETVDWNTAATIAQTGKMILAGGLGEHNVAEAIRQVRPFGVDVSSAVEVSPGKKDPHKIAAFIAAVKNVNEE